MEPLFWPESYSILVDLEISIYLEREPHSELFRNLKCKNYGRVAEQILAVCGRDFDRCLAYRQQGSNYLTRIFMVLGLYMLAGWYLMIDPRNMYTEREKPVFESASDMVSTLIESGVAVSDFDKGFLYEFKGDADLFSNKADRAANNYTKAAEYYKSLTQDERERLIAYLDVEPLFLQYDIIWRNKFNHGFEDAYDFVEDFSRRITGKLAYAMLQTVYETDIL